jgi:hypothetical protein
MAFIDTTITEGGLPGNITNLFLNNGWTEVTQFMKVVYDTNLTKPNVTRFTSNGNEGHRIAMNAEIIQQGAYVIHQDGQVASVPITVEDTGTAILLDLTGTDGSVFEVYLPTYLPGNKTKVYVSRHDVIRNASGMLYGIAVAGWQDRPLSHIPYMVKENGTYEFKNATFINDAINRFADVYADHSTLYVYQLDGFLSPTYENSVLPWNSTNDRELLRLCLDTEVWAAAWNVAANKFEVKQTFPNNMQSPIVEVKMRLSQVEQFYDDSLNSDVQFTNWWLDSQIRVKGLLDNKTAMLILTADTAPMWEGNTTPSVPLYMGDFDKYENSNNGNTSEVINRSFKFDAGNGGSKNVTITTAFPCVTTGSYVDVYLVGDFSADIPPDIFYSEWAWLEIDGQSFGGMTTGQEVETNLPDNRNDPRVKKFTFNLQNISGKKNFQFSYRVSAQVSVSRAWIDLRINTEAAMNLACLWAGTAYTDKTHVQKDTAENVIDTSRDFDYTDPSLSNFQPVLQPFLKNYVTHPSNGVDSIMVKTTKFGSRYQSYYLTWEQSSNGMPPNFIHDSTGLQYPRGWMQDNTSDFKYQFNPSRYSDKVHSSKAYIYHPELGVHGSLRGVILMPPLSILNGDELREKVGCDEPIFYHYHLVEGVSPLTKRPSTQYRPAGLGIRTTPFPI